MKNTTQSRNRRRRDSMQVIIKSTKVRDVGGVLMGRTGGKDVLLGRSPERGVEITMVNITSPEIENSGGALHIRCTNCKELKPLIEMGMRMMPDGSLRNQPQCPSCRSAKGKAKRMARGTDAGGQ